MNSISNNQDNGKNSELKNENNFKVKNNIVRSAQGSAI
jgi:hypothetical protein